MAILQTSNLTLTPCCPDDAADFISLELDPEVMHFLNGGAVDHNTTNPDDVTFLMPRGTESYVWTARRNDNNGFVGWFCLYPENEKLAELGYRLRREEWGKEFALEGALALINLGFKVGGYDKIVACTMAVHHPSRRVMEKAGMTYSHTSPTSSTTIPGSEHGEVWYAVTRPE